MELERAVGDTTPRITSKTAKNQAEPFPLSPAISIGVGSGRENDDPVEALRLERRTGVRNQDRSAGPRHIVGYWRPGCRAQARRAFDPVGLANLAREADHKRIAGSKTAAQRE